MKRRLILLLDNWKPWVVIAYVALTVIVASLFVLFNRTAREEASRAAVSKAAAATQVGQCFTAVKNAPVTARFLQAHEALIDNSIEGNKAALRLEPANDPLRAVREASLKRLAVAQENAREIDRIIKGNTPTKKHCVHLAEMLGVNDSRYLKGAKP